MRELLILECELAGGGKVGSDDPFLLKGGGGSLAGWFSQTVAAYYIGKALDAVAASASMGAPPAELDYLNGYHAA
jgi:hypothetical protein